MKSFRFTPLMIVMAAALLVAGCNNGADHTFQGWIEADLLFVGPDEVGRVETLAVREGDQVKKGDPLCTLDSDLQEADVQQLAATVANARYNFDRADKLLKTAAGTQKAYDDAQAALREAEARLNSAQTRLARRKVFSPATGVVQQVYYRPGEIVPVNRPVLSILPPGNVKVRFYVPESALPTLALGDFVNVECDGCASPVSARISFISQTVEYTPPVIYSLDERSKLVFLIEARTDHPDKLRVGQPVSVVRLPKEARR